MTEQDSHNRDKVKATVDLSNYATKRKEMMMQTLIHLI